MRLIIIIILWSLCYSALATPTNILIYAGPGVGPQSLSNTVQVITQLVSDKYTVMTVGPETIKNSAWLADTALLIFPGGADLPYVANLHGKGTDNIRQYVQAGGKFIGICAGAYFAADRIEFAKGNAELEVTGTRLLKFFPGLVEGPTFAGFDHRDVSKYAGTRAAQIYWQLDTPFALHTEFTVYYNGGGHFVDAASYDNVTVLARYAKEAAIIESNIGKGKVILSGPHFEQDPMQLDSYIEQLRLIKKPLVAANASRLQLAKHLLARLNITTKS